jgi:hypothetical protein
LVQKFDTLTGDIFFGDRSRSSNDDVPIKDSSKEMNVNNCGEPVPAEDDLVVVNRKRHPPNVVTHSTLEIASVEYPSSQFTPRHTRQPVS